jgi:hypothetical protein
MDVKEGTRTHMAELSCAYKVIDGNKKTILGRRREANVKLELI